MKRRTRRSHQLETSSSGEEALFAGSNYDVDMLIMSHLLPINTEKGPSSPNWNWWRSTEEEREEWRQLHRLAFTMMAVSRTWRRVLRKQTNLLWQRLAFDRQFTDYVQPTSPHTASSIIGQFGQNVREVHLGNVRHFDANTFTWSIRQMPALKKLTASDCDLVVTDEALRTVVSLGHVTDVSLTGPRVSDKCFTDMAATKVTCPHLRSLAIPDAPIADNGILAMVRHCPNLTALDVSQKRVAQNAPRINSKSITAIAENLTSLKVLNIEGSALNDTALEAICQKLTKLNSLYLTHCVGLTPASLRVLCDSLTSLERLGLTTANTLDHIARLTKLRHLIVDTNDEISSLEPLKSLTHLSHVSLVSCVRVTDVTPLASLPRLNTLNLDACVSLEDLSPFENLKSLKSFSVRDTSVVSIESLCNPGGVEMRELDLSRCAIANLDSLTTMNNLTSLSLTECDHIESIETIRPLVNIQKLHMSQASVSNISALEGMADLTVVALEGFPNLRHLNPLSHLTKIEYLDVQNSPRLHSLQPLQQLVNMRWLRLTNCPKLTTLRPLSQMQRLNRLDMAGCQNIRSLQPLTHLSSLEHLDVRRCVDIYSLEPLANLPLQYLALTSRETMEMCHVANVRILCVERRWGDSMVSMSIRMLHPTAETPPQPPA